MGKLCNQQSVRKQFRKICCSREVNRSNTVLLSDCRENRKQIYNVCSATAKSVFRRAAPYRKQQNFARMDVQCVGRGSGPGHISNFCYHKMHLASPVMVTSLLNSYQIWKDVFWQYTDDVNKCIHDKTVQCEIVQMVQISLTKISTLSRAINWEWQRPYYVASPRRIPANYIQEIGEYCLLKMELCQGVCTFSKQNGFKLRLLAGYGRSINNSKNLGKAVYVTNVELAALALMSVTCAVAENVSQPKTVR